MSVKIGGVDIDELASFISEYLAKPAFQYKIPKQALMLAMEEWLFSQGAKVVQLGKCCELCFTINDCLDVECKCHVNDPVVYPR